MGLFIGASVISLLEVGMLVFDFLKSLVYTRSDHVKILVLIIDHALKNF